MSEAKIFMIPCPIVEDGLETIPKATISVIHDLSYYVVERARTARRFIKTTNHPLQISELQIFELDKNNPSLGLNDFLAQAKKGTSIGVLSEAGCPGIADPGALAVKWAHQNDIDVIPLIGPSSILLALIASGFNGQNFSFHGYLPVKKPELSQKLKQLESHLSRNNQTQIFMETPYRNHGLLEVAFKVLSPSTKLCVASNINAPDEWIKTKTLKEWKKEKIEIHKKPTMFLIGR